MKWLEKIRSEILKLAPSKRIHKIFASKVLSYKDAEVFYANQYVADGNCISKINKMRSLCLHFNEWLNKILKLQ